MDTGTTPAKSDLVPAPLLYNPLVNVATRTGYTPELADHFPTGAAIARTIQYYNRLLPGNEGPLDIRYWEQLANEFYVPEGILRLHMINEETKQRIKIDLTRETLKHFFASCYHHRIRLLQHHLGDIKEYYCDPANPPSLPSGLHSNVPEPPFSVNTTHVIEMPTMKQLVIYENGWQTHMIGIVHVLLSPYTTVEYMPAPPGVKGNAEGKTPQLVTTLRLQYLCLSTLGQRLLVPYDVMLSHLEIREIPHSLVEEIIAYGVKRERERVSDTSEHGQQEPEVKRRKMEEPPVSNPTFTEPEKASLSARSPRSITSHESSHDSNAPRFMLPRPRMTAFRFIDEYGFPSRMGHLTTLYECIGQMRELMQHHISHGQGPMETLQRFADSMDTKKDTNTYHMSDKDGTSANVSNPFPLEQTDTVNEEW